MDKVKVGVVGGGYWGRKHIYEYNQAKNVDLTWFCDIDTKLLKQHKKDFDIPYITTNFEELLSSDVEAISICTNNENHYKMSKKALLAGKNVLVEKPLTLNSKTAKDLVETAKEKKLKLAVGHIFRFNNGIEKIKELIKNEFFGEAYSLRLQWTTVLYPKNPIDILFDLCPHTFDIMNYLLDVWPENITCKAKGSRNKELYDNAYLISDFKNGMMTHTEVSWILPGKVRELYVLGSKKSASLECLSQQIKIFEDEKVKDLKIKSNNTILDELTHFADSIIKDYEPKNNGQIGLKTIELIEKAVESNNKGKTIIV
jgi:predicted dehydrogenase